MTLPSAPAQSYWPLEARNFSFHLSSLRPWPLAHTHQTAETTKPSARPETISFLTASAPTALRARECERAQATHALARRHSTRNHPQARGTHLVISAESAWPPNRRAPRGTSARDRRARSDCILNCSTSAATTLRNAPRSKPTSVTLHDPCDRGPCCCCCAAAPPPRERGQPAAARAKQAAQAPAARSKARQPIARPSRPLQSKRLLRAHAKRAPCPNLQQTRPRPRSDDPAALCWRSALSAAYARLS